MDFEAPVPLEEEEEAAQAGLAAPLLALLRQQQAKREQMNAGLQQTVGKQRAQAQGMRTLGMLSSFGQNPLLRNLQGEAGQQASTLESMAARTEGRLDNGRDLDPLGIARLQQAAEKLEQDRERAAKELGFKQSEAARKAEEARLKAKRVGGLKPPKPPNNPYLPAGEAAALGQVDTALSALDDLNDAHAKLAGGLKGLGAKIPTADAAKYDDKILATAQAIGYILEGGKLAAGDEIKYRKMLPDAFDLPERRAEKIENVKKLLRKTREAKIQAFKQAGYKMEGFSPAPTPERTPAAQAMPTDASGNLTLDDVPAPPKRLTPKDEAAIKWARANRNDPRAAAIFQKLGVAQ